MKQSEKRLQGVDIQRVKSREALQQQVRKALKAGVPVSRDPYWKELAKGRYVGYRFFTADSLGTWLARFYDGEKYQWKALGDFAPVAEDDRYQAAKKAAEEWFEHLEGGGSPKSCTVKAACEAYVAAVRAGTDKKKKPRPNPEAAADDMAARYKRLVDDDEIAKIELAKLRRNHVKAWSDRLLKSDGSHSSYNRNAAALRAALNFAKRCGLVASAAAWEEELKGFEDAGGKRTLYLNVDARRKLIENASDEAKPLFRAMCLQPVRPGDIPAATVGDLDVENRSLTIRGKTGERTVPLGREALEHFKACAKGKLPSAWLIARADGSQWKKEAWRDEIKLAAAGAKLPKATVAYTLRHSVITDLVKGGLDIFHVAKLAGTSVAMIEKHYGHLQHEHARKALDKLALA